MRDSDRVEPGADLRDIGALARALEACSPLATVARGYAILTRADNGELVQSIAQTAPGDRLHARVRDGVLAVTVEPPRSGEDDDAPL